MMEWLTYCLYCLDSAALCMLNVQQFDLFGQIQTSQTGGRPFSDTPPPMVCSLIYPSVQGTFHHHNGQNIWFIKRKKASLQ